MHEPDQLRDQLDRACRHVHHLRGLDVRSDADRGQALDVSRRLMGALARYHSLLRKFDEVCDTTRCAA